MKMGASLTHEEDTDSCSDTSSQSSAFPDAASDSASRTSSQSSFNLEDLFDRNASDGSSEEGSQASRGLEDMEGFVASNSNSDADSQGSSEVDEGRANETDTDSSSSRKLDASAHCDADTDADSEASIESRWWGQSHSERKIWLGICDAGGYGMDFCYVYLNYDWEHIACNYRDYTGKGMWDDIAAFLNAAEPIFNAHAVRCDDGSREVHVDTPKRSHVKHLKQLLVELERRYQGYSVPKLMRLIKDRLYRPKFSMRAMIEFQDKFGTDAALHMLESHADIMFQKFSYSYA